MNDQIIIPPSEIRGPSQLVYYPAVKYRQNVAKEIGDIEESALVIPVGIPPETSFCCGTTSVEPIRTDVLFSRLRNLQADVLFIRLRNLQIDVLFSRLRNLQIDVLFSRL